ncbi:MAG: response regulator transcription factor [bacterium]|nr:response regulator transcription factor [bacterium]
MSEDRHILVVEDEDHLAFGIKFNLEAEDYRVTVVGDGYAALKVLESEGESIALVVLDIMLPGMSGYDVCEKLRAQGLQMPVLILSARTLAEDRARGFDVGADQYMLKPFDLRELLSRVKNLLVRTGGAPTPPVRELSHFEFGRARINFETFESFVDDEPVKLTAMNLKLLKFFVLNEGRAIPRSELLEEVWDMPGHIHTRAPDQFMRRLREVFEENPAEPRHFLTIRDVGYRFVADPDAAAE